MFAMHQGRCSTTGVLARRTAPPTATRGHTSLPPRKACQICGSQASALGYGVKHLRNTPRAHTAVTDTATLSEVDIDSRFDLSTPNIDFYRNNGFVKLPRVFNEATLGHYGPSMSLEVKEADKTPYQQDPDYKQAFTQVTAPLVPYKLEDTFHM